MNGRLLVNSNNELPLLTYLFHFFFSFSKIFFFFSFIFQLLQFIVNHLDIRPSGNSHFQNTSTLYDGVGLIPKIYMYLSLD
jgi:hypothetical protein